MPSPNSESSQELAAIPGNTYAVRAELKALGATWDSNDRVWKIAPEKLSLARAIVENQGKAAPETFTAARQDASRKIDVESLSDPFEEEAPEQVAITGNTYPVKDALKAIGATWNKDKRVWMIAEEKAEYARAIVRGDQNTSSD